uniref:Uncharacterized protein n=1 Tax=Timema cristinae TaxID=61476 RepID=A0A7R9DLE1_TIMCR|nr:unnamed protein product [Timema cristinae]
MRQTSPLYGNSLRTPSAYKGSRCACPRGMATRATAPYSPPMHTRPGHSRNSPRATATISVSPRSARPEITPRQSLYLQNLVQYESLATCKIMACDLAR